MLDIHEELHRLVLRSRWLRWANRNRVWLPGGMFGWPLERMLRLSFRLTEWKPTWSERQLIAKEMDR